MTYATRLDLLIVALRRATPFGRRRMLATHKRLIRRRIHLPSVPEGYRVVAGELVAKLECLCLAATKTTTGGGSATVAGTAATGDCEEPLRFRL